MIGLGYAKWYYRAGAAAPPSAVRVPTPVVVRQALMRSAVLQLLLVIDRVWKPFSDLF